VHLRPAFDALLDLEDAMADVVARSTQPALGAIKLAWWRERLEELDGGKVASEPRLKVAARELLPRGIRGAALARLEAGWAALLDENPSAELVLGRGLTLFELAASLLDVDRPEFLGIAAGVYAAGSLERRGLVPEGLFFTTECPRVPRRLRPITALAVLARRDLARQEPEATPARAWALLRHRLTGRL
jgi:phytoene synthase